MESKSFSSKLKDISMSFKKSANNLNDDAGGPISKQAYCSFAQDSSESRILKGRPIPLSEAAKYEVMKKKISFLDNTYPDKNLKPNLLFYRYLAPLSDVPTLQFSRHDRLEMWVPNTIVYDGLSSPFWLFSKEGRVYRSDGFANGQAVSRLGSNNKHELVAISKTLKYESMKGRMVGHEVELLNTDSLKEKLRAIGCNKERTAIQKFVKCKGKKAFICRTVWSREKPPYCFIITNNYSYDDPGVPPDKKFVVNVDDVCSCSILHTLAGKHCEETGRYLKNLVRFLQINMQVQFSQLVGDFTKDDSGDWYFLSLKAFKLRSLAVVPSLGLFIEKEFSRAKQRLGAAKSRSIMKERTREQYEKMSLCKLCQIAFSPDQLPHKLTMKMLIQAEKQLCHQGARLEWLNFGEYENYDTTALYQPHRICESCFELFKAIEDLRKQELELAWRMGIVEDRNDLVRIPEDGGSDDCRPIKHFARKSIYKKNSEEKNEWEMYKKANKVNQSMDPSQFMHMKTMTRYRLLVIFEELAEMSPEFMDAQKITLCYNFIGFEQKIVLCSAYALRYGSIVPIEKVRLYYFFTDSVSGVNQLLRQKDKAKIELYFDNNKAPSASTMLDLSDFCSPLMTQQRFYFNCTGTKAMCYIKFAIGLKRSDDPIDVSKIEIRQVKEGYPIYVAAETYYACEPLPKEWIDIVPSIRGKAAVQP